LALHEETRKGEENSSRRKIEKDRVKGKMEGSDERESVSLEDLKAKMADFAKERDWDQFHSPRNLLLALVNSILKL